MEYIQLILSTLVGIVVVLSLLWGMVRWAITNGIDRLQVEMKDLRSKSKEEYAASRSEFKEELAALRSESKEEYAASRSEFKEELAALRNEFKEELAASRSKSKEEYAASRSEFKEELAALRSEFKEEITGSRSDIKEEIRVLRSDFKELQDEVHKGFRQTGERIARLEAKIGFTDSQFDRLETQGQN